MDNKRQSYSDGLSIEDILERYRAEAPQLQPKPQPQVQPQPKPSPIENAQWLRQYSDTTAENELLQRFASEMGVTSPAQLKKAVTAEDDAWLKKWSDTRSESELLKRFAGEMRVSPEELPVAGDEDVKQYAPKKSRMAQLREDAMALAVASSVEPPPMAKVYQKEAPPVDQIEFDPRFNVDGNYDDSDMKFRFGDEVVNLEAEQDYTPPAVKPMEEEAPKRRRRSAKRIDDTDADYAPAREYGEDDDEYEPKPEDEAFFPMSFGEYLSSIATAILFRFRGAKKSAATQYDYADEDEAPEVPHAQACKYYGSFIRSLKMRTALAAICLAVLAWLSLGLPVPGMLQNVKVLAASAAALQFMIMLIALDVVAGAIVNLTEARVGADALAFISCLLTAVDAFVVALSDFTAPHMPLCIVSSASLFGVLFSSYLSTRALRKSLRVPSIAKQTYTVTAESGIKGRELTLLKSLRPLKGFVRRTEEESPDETFFRKAGPFVIIAAFLLAIIVAAVKKSFSDLIYIFSALLAPAVPFTALLCFALPYFSCAMRIFSSGAAIAGWSGLRDLGSSDNLIVTDRDLFPEETVEIESIRIFADADPSKIIGYAGSMLTASGCSVASCFGKLMEEQGCTMSKLENFEYLAGGGMKAVIDGSVVLCGSSDLIRLMKVRVPYRIVTKNSVLLAVDGILYGIFEMKYEALPSVRSALVKLIASGRHPIFAIRDFNITPEMLHRSFDLVTDSYDFPPYVERFKISAAEPTADSKVAAVVCREGLGPLTHLADTARGTYLRVRASLVISALGAVAGMLTVFIRLLVLGAVSPAFIFVFMLLWAIPVLLIGFLMK